MYLCHIAWYVTSDTFVIPKIIRKKVAEGLFNWPCLESGLDGVLTDAEKIQIRVIKVVQSLRRHLKAASSGVPCCSCRCQDKNLPHPIHVTTVYSLVNSHVVNSPSIQSLFVFSVILLVYIK